MFEEFKEIYLLPWETADEFIITKDDREKIFNDKESSLAVQLMHDINKINDGIDGRIYCCDGLCLAAAISPEIAVKTHKAFGKVET